MMAAANDALVRRLERLIDQHLGQMTLCYKKDPELGFLITPILQSNIPDGWSAIGVLTAQSKYLLGIVTNWLSNLTPTQRIMFRQTASRGRRLFIDTQVLILLDQLNEIEILRLIPSRDRA